MRGEREGSGERGRGGVWEGGRAGVCVAVYTRFLRFGSQAAGFQDGSHGSVQVLRLGSQLS